MKEKLEEAIGGLCACVHAVSTVKDYSSVLPYETTDRIIETILSRMKEIEVALCGAQKDVRELASPLGNGTRQ